MRMRIAIVEDEKKQVDLLVQYLKRFIDENETVGYGELQITEFQNGRDFLIDYKAVYDIVFMDIEMPGVDGLKAARRLREMDSDVILVFVTKMAQYAINGYEVNAFDYILKPINYTRLSSVLKRLLRNRLSFHEEEGCMVKTQYGVKKIPFQRIVYVEISGHKIIYHADEEIQSWGTLKEVENILPKERFVRISSCYIINLGYVKNVKGYEVDMGQAKLMIGRNRKSEFMAKLAAHIGGRG